ncbi:NUDIX hydrolase [Dasania sp. GY-MA-18]|uniref:Phosphatase NudJ n=1 Tax=Dasania phycosphaerae TaxID=2950436 RepID=A0A9J6RIJ3_9GAMM|nr:MULTISPECIES: NUDIX hydrolase [Dasania]MCR8921824.1 NUDIX hydrolase [Dasania sp. GY-MA-18]MCZ0864252.1 NUDIX hydrolase [Dasania phycosphaerae]MCZ0867980.1 NUDIX hydrolase [Dasania phycosphaerae]
MEWQPHVTVATVIERDEKFLLVEELSNGEQVYNQPAGHLDPNETLEQAAVRETLEETGWDIELQGLLGVALYESPHNSITYHRTTFYGKALKHHPERALDDGIIQAVWMSYEELVASSDKLRSRLVLSAIEQYRNGHRYPLDFIYR